MKKIWVCYIALTVGSMLVLYADMTFSQVSAGAPPVFANERAMVVQFAGDPTTAVKVVEANCDQATLDAIETALTPQPAPDEKLKKLEQAKSDMLSAGIAKDAAPVTELDKEIVKVQAEVDTVKQGAIDAAADAKPVSP